MKIIKLNNTSLSIPSKWEDLNFGQKMYTFTTMMRVMGGDLKDTPHLGLLYMLFYYTGYRTSQTPTVLLRVKYYQRALFCYLCHAWRIFQVGFRRYRYYVQNINNNRWTRMVNKNEDREIINFNLLRLSEEIDFVYKIDEETRQIKPLYTFATNPIRFIQMGKQRYYGKKFELDVTAKTDITAREFIDCYDLLVGINEFPDDKKAVCINQLCAILYPEYEDYQKNLCSDHHKKMKHVSDAIKFAVVYWFTGVAHFYATHPNYKVLFESTKKADSTKVPFGMNDIAIYLKKEGYGDPNTMYINDYFDAQVRSLRDSIADAIAKGAKAADIANKTGLSVATINSLL